jgi:hypothetical protein
VDMMARRHFVFNPSCCSRRTGFCMESVQAETGTPLLSALEHVSKSLPKEFRVHPDSGFGGYHRV